MNLNLMRAPIAQIRLFALLAMASSPLFGGVPFFVVASANSTDLGQPVTFTAYVYFGNPGDTVLFLDGSTPMGYGKISGFAATFTTQSLSVGTHEINAEYNGFLATPVSFPVNALPGNGLAPQSSVDGYQASFAITVADVNNDGYLDIITSDDELGAVGISLGSAGGQFASPVFYGAGTPNQWNVIAQDFNKDGNLDLAVMGDDGNVQILIGNGDGTFQAPVAYLAIDPLVDVDETVFVSAADLNGDSKIDLVVTGVDYIHILLGNGDGTFTLQPNPIFLGYVGNMTAIADFNGDNHADLATQDYTTTLTHIYLGVGDGTFTNPGTVVGTSQTDQSAAGIVVADFNNDGNFDIASAGNITDIALGNGTGTFMEASPVNTQYAVSVAFGDFDGDGNIDLLIGDGFYDAVDIFYGDGSGNFGNPYFAASPADDPYLVPLSLAVGDFNGDGVADVVAAGNDNDNAVYLGTAASTGVFSLSVTNSGSFTQGSTTAQFTIIASNTDGFYDGMSTTITSSLSPGLTPTAISGAGWTCTLGTLVCSRGDSLAGDLSYPSLTITASVASTAPQSVTASSVLMLSPPQFVPARARSRRSLNSDVYVAAKDTVVVPLAVPLTPQTITFGPLIPEIYTNAAFTVSATSDSSLPVTFGVSGDCIVDGSIITLYSAGNCVVTAYQAGNNTYAPATPVQQAFDIFEPVVTITSNPAATVTLGQPVTITAQTTALTANTPILFSDTGIPLGYGTLSGGAATFTTHLLPVGPRSLDANYLGYSNEVPAEPTVNAAVANALSVQPIVAGFAQVQQVFTADLNNDGYPDLVGFNYNGGSASASLGSANGTFAAPLTTNLGTHEAMNLVDVNQDGIPDIVAAGAGVLNIYLGNGDGTFQAAKGGGYTIGTNAKAIAAADLVGEGTQDLLIIDDNGLEVFMSSGPGTFYPRPYPFSLTAPGIFLQIADLNGDGAPDVLVQDATGNAYVLLNLEGLSSTEFAAAPGAAYGVGLALGDFNNDGNIDFATVGSGATQIYLGDGTGNFTAGSVVAHTGSNTAAAGDFNGDGNLDLVFGSNSGGTVDVFTNDGTGTLTYAYSGAPSSDTQASPSSFAVADFNGDGRTDFASAGESDSLTPYFGSLLPDLQLAKSHTGNFTQGQTGATYSLVVTNAAGASTTGTVTVTDTLPTGLTATSASGSGWTCTLGPPPVAPMPRYRTMGQGPAPPSLFCTRSDVLAVTAAYPAITVTVNVASDAPASVTNTATVSGNILSDPNTTANDVTVINTAVAVSQTITFPAPPAAVFGSAPFTLSATASSGLPVSFQVIGNCTVSGTTVTVTGAGSCTVTASQAGNSSYLPATSVIQTFLITKGTATVTLGPLTMAPVSVTTVPVDLSVIVTYNGSTVVPSAPGTYTVVATINDLNYQGSAIGTLVIAGAQSQTISFAAPPASVYGSTPFALNASASSGLPVTFTVAGNCTVSGTTVTVTGAGSCTVTATQAGNSSYMAATPVIQTFSIAKATATVTLSGLTGAPVIVTTVPTGLMVTVTYNGSTTIPTTAGTYTVVATVNDLNYQGSATGTLVIAGGLPSTITFNAPPATVYGSAPITLTASATSELPVTFTASGNCTVSGSSVTITGAGSCTVTAQQAGGSGYLPATPVVQTFAIAKATATVTLGPLTQAPVTATTAPAGLSVSITYNGTATLPTAPGTYTVVATVNSANYQGSATGTLTIAAGVPTITWSPASLAFGTPLGAAQLDASSNVPGTFVYSPAAGAVLSAGPNTLTVTFTPATGLGYSVTTAQVVIQVGAANQTITFQTIGSHLSTDAPFALSATASSGLPVTFSIVSGPATVSGNILTITGPGTIVVEASVAGNTDYSSATLTQTFTVAAASQLTLTAVVNSASYASGPLTPGYISAAFGSNLASGILSATTLPLPTTLGATSISILDASGQTLSASLFYVSPGQVNFLVPDNAQAGNGTLTLIVNGQSASLPIQIGGTDVGIYSANSSGTGAAVGNALHVTTAGVSTYTPLSTCTGAPAFCISSPIQFVTPGESVYLVLYGTGMRGRSSLANVTVTIGSTVLPALYAGPQGTFEGLDQLNVQIPTSLIGTGQTTVQVTVDGQAANPLGILIQ